MKLLTFLYGIVSYIVFFLTFLYTAGFIANFFVPKSIDTGAESSLGTALLINTLLLSVFAIQHTIMARPGFKQWWTKIIGTAAERSTFVLFSSLALILLYWQWRPIKTIVWEVEDEMFRNIITGIYIFGLLVVLLSTFMINHFDLFGLKQVYENLTGKISSKSDFKTGYFYGLVRHPIMTGFLIMFWAAPTMTIGRLFFAIVTSLYIFIAVKYLEEKDLLNTFGEQYSDYKKKVPMLIPFIGWK